jgi:Tol biopolymer transport system component
MRPDGSDARRLADRTSDPAFSPDGRRIAVAGDRDENGELSYGERVSFANELYIMNADGSHRRRLTSTKNLNELQPSWLPSGTRIAYQRGKAFDNAEGTVLMQINADGRCPRPLLADPGLDTWYAAPAWRPGEARAGDNALRC